MLKKKLNGKLQALRTLKIHAQYFSNWFEVFRAYRRGNRLPPLQIRRAGIVLKHGPSDDAWSLFREIFVERCYTRPEFYTPKPSDTVIDCGANVGFFALYLESVAPGIRVHCFEPSTSNRSRLSINISENLLENLITVHPVAVMDREGVLELTQAPQAGSTSAFDASLNGSKESVRSISLDQAIAMTGAQKIDLLKIDVEGAEIEILEGASAECWQKIQRVVLEYHEAIRPGCLERVRSVLSKRYSRIHAWPVSPKGELGILEASRH